MDLTYNERQLLSYLRDHCPSPDQAGGLPLDRGWTSPDGAKKTHSKTIAGLLGCSSKELESLTETLKNRGLAGFTRTGTSFCLWITDAGKRAVAPQDSERADAEAEADNRYARRIFAILAGVFVVAFLGQLFLGRRLAPEFVLPLNAILAVILGVIIFRQFPNTEATAGGSASGGRCNVYFKLGGAAAAALVFFCLLTVSMTYFVHRPVQVHLEFQRGGAAPATARHGPFEIYYRRTPYPQGRVVAREGSASIQDLPFWASKLIVNDIRGSWYVTAKEHAGEAGPWEYEIRDGEVTIPIVEKPPDADPLPRRGDVKSLLEKEGISEQKVRQPGKFTKRDVSLTIQNDSDRTITLVACDCPEALKPGPVVDGKGVAWPWFKDLRGIQPKQRSGWPHFDNFREPTGWFALFVRCDDPLANREVQRPLGVFNLFNVREPRVVIDRTTGDGIGFMVNRGKSILGE